MYQQYCPEIHYQLKKENIVLTSCYATEGELYLPDKLYGHDIKEIAPYAFSEEADIEKKDILVWKSDNADFFVDRHRICKEEVVELRLPINTCEIGRYAFYRCRNLRRLIISDRLLDIGGGAFTGCRVEEVEIHFYNGEKSCLKSILDEIRFAIRATLCYHKADGSLDTAIILFPEHYEEAVENTPARMLETHHHGSGGYYRQCFYERKLDFQKYDALFSQAVALENPKIVIELALSRLLTPVGLLSKYKEVYEQYLHAQMEDVACYVLEKEGMEEIAYLTQHGVWTKEGLEKAIEKAGMSRKTECLSMLMDVKRQMFPEKRKEFKL